MALQKRIRISNIPKNPPKLWWRVLLTGLFWIPVAAPIVVGVFGFALLQHWSRDLPEVPNLDEWDRSAPQSSEIFAADGSLVADIPFAMGKESGHRTLVPFDKIPKKLVNALVAAEDVRFYQHRGVDLRGILRAAVTNFKAGRIVEGASTMTQQVARNLLPLEIGHQRKLKRKAREAILATRIENYYDKDRILEVYANHTFFGAGAHGVAAAAKRYFGKELSEITVAEAALIAGLAQAPSRANPLVDLDAATDRRNTILDRMHRAGFIDNQQLEKSEGEPIFVRESFATYGSLAPWHTEHARRQVQARWPDLYARGGLTIETTASPIASLEAERRAREKIAELFEDPENMPEIGSVSIDYVTRYVETSLGGWDWQASKFDRSTQACRQPGSAFKPVVYAAAIENHAITAGTPLRDAPIAEWDAEHDVHWKPTNGARLFRGVALAQEALASSLNAPAVDVLDRVGTTAVVNIAKKLGISTPMAAVRPLALGASCVYPFELASAIATFPRNGLGLEPLFVSRVRKDGEVLLDLSSPYDPTISAGRRLDQLAAYSAKKVDPVIKPTTAYIMTSMLREVVRQGTGREARRLGRDAAGKTGTTNNNTDAWFVGFDGRIITSVWLGHDNPEKPLGDGRDGSHAALPLWTSIMWGVEDGREKVPLLRNRPPGIVQVRIDRETGLRAETGAGGAADVFFERGTQPSQSVAESFGQPVDIARESHSF